MESMQDIYKRRWLIFAAITMCTFISCVDASSVNVALPGMADELGVSMASIEWVVTAYTLVIICLILVFGKLGDTIGKDKVFKAGILGFLAGAVLCFSAQNYAMLIFGRVVEGIGSAATMANSQGLIVQVFPLQERGKALGLSGSTVALGTMVGPSLGGFIVSILNWNWIFAMDIPVALLSFLLCCRFLPKFEDARQNRRVDVGGALLFMIMILCIYTGVKLLQAGSAWYLHCVLLLAVAFVVGRVFVRWENKSDHPLLSMDMFRNKLFVVSVFCAMLMFFSMSGIIFLQSFYLQKVQMLDAAHTGMLMMVSSITMFVVAPFSGQLSDKIGSELICFVGLCIATGALLIMSTLGVNSSLLVYVAGAILLSMGNAMFQSPNTSLIMSNVGKHQTGIAGSINGLARNLGNVFGISLSTVFLYNIMSAKLGYPVMSFSPGEEEAFVAGMQWVCRFMACTSFTGAVLTGIRWKRRRGKK